jgi:predicted AAA+ superfamily ATPase
LPTLFNDSFRDRGEYRRLGKALTSRVVAGGYPAALARNAARRRAAWYRGYAETMTQRDVRDLARIGALDALPKLMETIATQSAHLLNATDLAAPFELSRPTIRNYVTLLERLFLVSILPPWHSNRLKRLVKTPKLHIGDTGLGASLLGIDSEALWADRALYGQFLETFVCQELYRQASWDEDPTAFYHYRDKEEAEVDVVMERHGKLSAVEIKAAATVKSADFKGIKKLKHVSGKRFAAGVVLYDGAHVLPFGEKLHAVPVSTLWNL